MKCYEKRLSIDSVHMMVRSYGLRVSGIVISTDYRSLKSRILDS